MIQVTIQNNQMAKTDGVWNLKSQGVRQIGLIWTEFEKTLCYQTVQSDSQKR